MSFNHIHHGIKYQSALDSFVDELHEHTLAVPLPTANPFAHARDPDRLTWCAANTDHALALWMRRQMRIDASSWKRYALIAKHLNDTRARIHAVDLLPEYLKDDAYVCGILIETKQLSTETLGSSLAVLSQQLIDASASRPFVLDLHDWPTEILDLRNATRSHLLERGIRPAKDSIDDDTDYVTEVVMERLRTENFSKKSRKGA